MPAKNWYLGSRPTGNQDDQPQGQGGFTLGNITDPNHPLAAIIAAIQQAGQVGTSGESAQSTDSSQTGPGGSPPADSVATGQMASVGSGDAGAGPGGGAEGAAPAGSGEGSGPGDGGGSGSGGDGGGSGGGSGAGSAMRRGGRVSDRQRTKAGDPDSDRDMRGRKDYRKVVRHEEGGFSVGRGVGR